MPIHPAVTLTAEVLNRVSVADAAARRHRDSTLPAEQDALRAHIDHSLATATILAAAAARVETLMPYASVPEKDILTSAVRALTAPGDVHG